MWICATIYGVLVCGIINVTWTMLKVAAVALEGFPLP
jgi:hypothetical protein